MLVDDKVVMEHLTLMNLVLPFTERLQHFIHLHRHPVQLQLLPLQLIAPSFQVVLLLLRFPLHRLLLVLLLLLLLLILHHHQLIFPPSQEVQLEEFRHHVSLTLKRRCYSARMTSSSELRLKTKNHFYTTQTHTHIHTRHTLKNSECNGFFFLSFKELEKLISSRSAITVTHTTLT